MKRHAITLGDEVDRRWRPLDFLSMVQTVDELMTLSSFVAFGRSSNQIGPGRRTVAALHKKIQEDRWRQEQRAREGRHVW
jgi:hypothetical protein